MKNYYKLIYIDGSGDPSMVYVRSDTIMKALLWFDETLAAHGYTLVNYWVKQPSCFERFCLWFISIRL